MADANKAGSILLANAHLRCEIDPERATITELTALDPAGREQVFTGSVQPAPPLFALRWEGDATSSVLRPLSCGVETLPSQAQLARLRYDLLPDGDRPGSPVARALLEVRLEADGEELELSLEIENLTPDRAIQEVVFPVIPGLRAAEDPAAEFLFYPFFAGVRLAAPRLVLPRARSTPEAAAPLAPRPDGEQVTVRQLYCGALSMPWLALSGPETTVALISYDPTFEVVALEVAAPLQQPEQPPGGLDFRLARLRPLRPGEVRRLAPCGLLACWGTWHRAADRYRTWTRRLFLPPRVPAWVRESHALTAHYDFKWQDGTFTHTFADIPHLYRRTAQEGIKHLFLAGWSTGGFDKLYPEYFPDLQLGTVMDFIRSIRTVRREGGFVTLYINTALFGQRSRFCDTLGRAWATKGRHGEMLHRHFFAEDFTVNCRGVRAYQRLMRDTVQWLVGEVGASGVYLDCFAAIGPHLCFDPTHGHPHPAHWNQDALATLRQIEDGVREVNPDAFTMIEGCGDIYGQWVVAHLIHGWHYPNSYPEIFRYTFPEYVLVDMVYPSKGQSFRPKRISEQAYQQLHRTWVNGCLIWIYDQEDQRFCNFRSDPDMWHYVKQLLGLREEGRHYFAYGRFDEAVGLQADEKSIVVRRFVNAGYGDRPGRTGQDHAPAVGTGAVAAGGVAGGPQVSNGLEMLAVWNRAGTVNSFLVTNDLATAWRSAAQGAIRLRGVTIGPAPCDIRCEESPEGVRVVVPPVPVVLIFVEATNRLEERS